MNVEALKGIQERELLRPQRVLNYRVKRAANFCCSVEGCKAKELILVVAPKDGAKRNALTEDERRLTTVCERHLDFDKHIVTPGQWPERIERELKA